MRFHVERVVAGTVERVVVAQLCLVGVRGCGKGKAWENGGSREWSFSTLAGRPAACCLSFACRAREIINGARSMERGETDHGASARRGAGGAAGSHGGVTGARPGRRELKAACTKWARVRRGQACECGEARPEGGGEIPGIPLKHWKKCARSSAAMPVSFAGHRDKRGSGEAKQRRAYDVRFISSLSVPPCFCERAPLFFVFAHATETAVGERTCRKTRE